MCEKNFKVWCALNNVLIDEDRDSGQDIDVSGGIQQVPDEEEWDSMDVDTAQDADEGGNGKRESKGKTSRVAQLVREKIRKVLEVVTELADKRARQCDEGDFLRLLLAFNEEGIHFT
jgi:18S rRNA (adenine1779-N6/adenine1780-N6)-dimethyltransferase